LQPEIKGVNTEETMTMDGFSSASIATIKLSNGEIEDLREAFRLFDADGKGVINFRELKEVADALALEHGNKENSLSSKSFRHLSDLLNGVNDDDEDLELNEESFIRLVSERHEEDDTLDEYQRVFDLFDTKGKGYICLSDLRKVSEELGESMTDEELDEMIAKAAPTTGKVTLDDFQKIMTRRLFS
jgi:centrin-1